MSIERIMYITSFNILVNNFPYIEINPCGPGIKLIWSRCIFFYMYHQILYINMSFKVFCKLPALVEMIKSKLLWHRGAKAWQPMGERRLFHTRVTISSWAGRSAGDSALGDLSGILVSSLSSFCHPLRCYTCLRGRSWIMGKSVSWFVEKRKSGNQEQAFL